ncbi:FAD:protein FMN transferase [Halomonas sp. M4R5S39]|uniref:FAD:protein FMN transferase n=1 Tax=Halomonas kalidii TaxID=3043293 RepID=UPI0024A97730|nr:FAD:protein FMN transferase [Halomonas kalidii]MDI5986105.1 FAD:protein FMN transferase [Halomonas kalidii]
MISVAARRDTGPALRPALFLFALVWLPVTLLVGCRSQSPLHQFEGTALDTGYHITLYADLDDGARELLKAGIQGELVGLEQELALWLVPLRHALGALSPGAESADEPQVDVLLQMTRALAVDRLDALLEGHGIEHAMLELGGVVRTRGQAGGRPWRLALDRPGLPGEGAPGLRLGDAALVHLDAKTAVLQQATLGGEPGEQPAARRLLSVSVVAPTAVEADRQARELMSAGPDAVAQAADRPVRIVVLTPQGIEIHHGSALEPYLEA